MIANLLKMTNCVNIELIPYGANHLDKKTFSWTLASVDFTEMEFIFTYDHPMYISQEEEADKMKVTFENTQLFLVPEDENLLPIDNQWPVINDIPP